MCWLSLLHKGRGGIRGMRKGRLLGRDMWLMILGFTGPLNVTMLGGGMRQTNGCIFCSRDR